MLILTRRTGESVIINDDIKVTILGIKGNQIRLGIKAPKNTPVHREEIYERIQEKQEKQEEQEEVVHENNQYELISGVQVRRKKTFSKDNSRNDVQ